MKRWAIYNNTVGEISKCAKLQGGWGWQQKGNNRETRIRGARLWYMGQSGKLVFKCGDGEVENLAGVYTNFIETAKKSRVNR